MKTEMFTTNSCFKSGCPRHKWWWGDLATSCLGWGMVAVSHCARKGAGLSQLFLLQAAWHLGAWSQRYWLKSSVLLWESTDTEKSWILMDIAPCLLKTSRKGAFHALSQKLFHTPQGRLTPPLSVVLVLLALCPFYLIPVKKYHFLDKRKSPDAPVFVLKRCPFGSLLIIAATKIGLRAVEKGCTV